MSKIETTMTATMTTTTGKYPWSVHGLYDNPSKGYAEPQRALTPSGLEYQLPWESSQDFSRRIGASWEDFELDHWQA